MARIEHLLTGQKLDPGRTAADNRLVVDAIVFGLKTGIPSADLPSRFGKSDIVRKRFDRWASRGVWRKITAATDEADLGECNCIRRRSRPTPSPPPGGGVRSKKEDADTRRCLGRSRGGLSTKTHVAVSRRGRLLRLVLTPGHAGDCPQAEGLLSDLPHGTVGHVIADAAYDSDALRQSVRRLRARCCIRQNPMRKRKKRYDRSRYRNRNVIERFFCRTRRCRRVASRYEKKAKNFAGFIYLAAFATAEE